MSYIRKQQCKYCHEPHWFTYWTGRYCARSTDGLFVGNLDYVFHRFKNTKDKLGERRIEHIMVVELKTGSEKLGMAQQDSLSVFNRMLNEMIPTDGTPILVKSRPHFIVKGDKKVVWHGAHLLRVPVEETNVGPFMWDEKWILPSNVLISVLNFENDPRHPLSKLDVDRRHKPPKTLPLLMEAINGVD